MLFLGTFDYAMDERGRIPLPPRYRDAFRDGVVLSQGAPDPCLRVYTRDAFALQASSYTAVPDMKRKGRDLRRSLFARSDIVELDKQNRLLIPQHLREYAGLSGKVLVVGAGESLEIWSPERWAREMERIDAELAETMETAEPR